jgi:hypothetical protein
LHPSQPGGANNDRLSGDHNLAPPPPASQRRRSSSMSSRDFYRVPPGIGPRGIVRVGDRPAIPWQRRPGTLGNADRGR